MRRFVLLTTSTLIGNLILTIIVSFAFLIGPARGASANEFLTGVDSLARNWVGTSLRIERMESLSRNDPTEVSPFHQVLEWVVGSWPRDESTSVSLCVADLGMLPVISQGYNGSNESLFHFQIVFDSSRIQPRVVLAASEVLSQSELEDVLGPSDSGIVTEWYGGQPANGPIISLYQALDSVLFAPPSAAQILIAKYVSYSCNDSTNVPAWVIELYGLPSMFGPRADGSQIKTWITVVDAQTGIRLFSANAPCPWILNR